MKVQILLENPVYAKGKTLPQEFEKLQKLTRSLHGRELPDDVVEEINEELKHLKGIDASEKELVMVGRLFTIISIILGAGLGLILTSAGQAFNLLLMIGSGTGLIYILRWFWWRINAYTEIIAMISSLIIAGYMNFGDLDIAAWMKIVYGACITTVVWVIATYITPPDDDETLQNFVNKIDPGGPGWKKYSNGVASDDWHVPKGILSMVLGCFSVYGLLLGVGQLIYGNFYPGIFICGLGTVSSIWLLKIWK